MSFTKIDLEHWQDIEIPENAELFEARDDSTVNQKHARNARECCQALEVAMTRLQTDGGKPVIACQRRRQLSGSSWILLCSEA